MAAASATVIGAVTSVPSAVTEADAAAFRAADIGTARGQALDYRGQIVLIDSVQRRLFTLVPVGEGIPQRQTREPEDLFRKGSGLCYDRSRTLDKAFSWLGFETRHVYILYPEAPGTGQPMAEWRSLVTRGTPSHAVTEVKTLKGWLLLDSTESWMSVTESGEPVPADQIPARLREFRYVPKYFTKKYVAIRGLYSRRGQLYPPYVPLPDINWNDFIAGLWFSMME